MLGSFVLLGLFSLLLPLLCGASVALPNHSDLEVRLLTPVGSRWSRPGDTVQAVVIAPVETGGDLLLLQGATLSGAVESAQAVGLGLRRGAAKVDIRFDKIRLTDGAEFPLSVRVLQVETARERVDGEGRITGIDPAANVSSGVSFLMSTLLLHSELEVPALMLKFLAARSPDSEIFLPPGTELFVRLTEDLTLDASAVQTKLPPGLSLTEVAAVRAALDRLPIEQAESENHRSSDLINVVLLGNEQDVDSAFRAAGWTGERKHSLMAFYGMLHCLVLRKGFHMAPMSRLQLNGQPPTGTYQKSLDTMAKRHHARFWRQGDSDIWLGAATEDVGLMVRRLRLTHAIRANIDDERAKIVNDLWFAGCVRGTSLLRRNNLRTIERDDFSIQTDNEIAVLRLGHCEGGTDFSSMPRLTLRTRMLQGLLAVGIDIGRANPATVGITAAHMVAGMVRKTAPPAVRKYERASILDKPSDQLPASVKLTAMSVSTGTATPFNKVGR